MSRRSARIRPSGMSIIIFFLRAIKKLVTIVDYGNSQINLKLTIINIKIPVDANSVLFDSERLYTIWRS